MIWNPFVTLTCYGFICGVRAPRHRLAVFSAISISCFSSEILGFVSWTHSHGWFLSRCYSAGLWRGDIIKSSLCWCACICELLIQSLSNLPLVSFHNLVVSSIWRIHDFRLPRPFPPSRCRLCGLSRSSSLFQNIFRPNLLSSSVRTSKYYQSTVVQFIHFISAFVCFAQAVKAYEKRFLPLGLDFAA